MFPSHFRYPDTTCVFSDINLPLSHYRFVSYTDKKLVTVGGVEFHLFHDKGETDDSTWVFIPKYKAIASGDLIIWAAPNCGNPQKV